MSSHIIPARVTGPVGYTPREMPAISEGTPANAEAVLLTRLESIKKAAELAKPVNKQPATPPRLPAAAGASVPAPSLARIPAPTPAQRRPPVASKAPARKLEQADVLAVLPDCEENGISRAQWAELLGLAHPIEISRLSSTSGRLKKIGKICANEGADGYLRYWLKPAGELRPSGIRRKGLTLRILNALPGNEAGAVKFSAVCAQMGIPDTEQRAAVNAMYRLERAGDITSRPHPDNRSVKLYWRPGPKVDESLAREEMATPKDIPAAAPADAPEWQPVIERSAEGVEGMLLERAARYRLLADVMDRLGSTLTALSPADARDVLLAAADVIRADA